MMIQDDINEHILEDLSDYLYLVSSSTFMFRRVCWKWYHFGIVDKLLKTIMSVVEIVNCSPITCGQFVLFSWVIETLPLITALASSIPCIWVWPWDIVKCGACSLWGLPSHKKKVWPFPCLFSLLFCGMHSHAWSWSTPP